MHREEGGGDDEFWEMLCFPYRLIHLTGHQFSLKDLLKYCYKQRFFFMTVWRFEIALDRGDRTSGYDIMQSMINFVN